MEKVRVYWNLHKHTWSIQSCKSGLVIDHRQFVSLKDAKFVVRKGGQKRVREQGKKNVHAFAVGYQIDNSKLYNSNLIDWDRVKYNPYTDAYFMHGGVSPKDNSWRYISDDFVGYVRMESLHHENGIVPRVYI